MANIEFEKERTIQEDNLEQSILEIALNNDMPFIHACGGNARCSTCRVLVLSKLDNLHPRNEAEKQLAKIKGLEKNIRLACQSKIKNSIKLRRLVLDDDDIDIAISESEITSGKEKKLAVLFSDIRGFTTFSEKHLSYDIIHILSRYFNQMGEAILNNNGFIDKYIGDGMMAIFGLEEDNPEDICFDAILAGLDMLKKLEPLNDYLKKNFNESFQIGIGIHYGEVVIGEVGHRKRRQFTAIGDAVNFASRIESTTKKAGVPFLVSEELYKFVKKKILPAKIFKTAVKGKSGDFHFYEVAGLCEEGKKYLDNIDLKKKIEKEFQKVISSKLAPQFLRLTFHDSATFEPDTNEGGANGSIHLEEELNREENAGLKHIIEILSPIKEKYSEDISWADLIYSAGAYAVFHCEGPKIDIELGRIDSEKVSPAMKLPHEEMSLEELKQNFNRLGLTNKDLVALSGAHTLGKANGSPITKDYMKFNNNYFRYLLNEDKNCLFLKTDLLLLEDAELRKYVESYALDEELFFDDFAESYLKMSKIGAKFKDGNS